MKNSPVILKSGKGKSILLSVTSAIFISLGISMLGNNTPFAIAVIFFFGLCLVTFMINLLPNASYLKIGDQGIEMKNLFRTTFIPWNAISGFRPRSFFLNTMVVFDLHQKLPATSGVKGKTGAFPDTYGMSAKKPAALLNEQKERFDSR